VKQYIIIDHHVIHNPFLKTSLKCVSSSYCIRQLLRMQMKYMQVYIVETMINDLDKNMINQKHPALRVFCLACTLLPCEGGCLLACSHALNNELHVPCCGSVD
jgi:hypothetical protein